MIVWINKVEEEQIPENISDAMVFNLGNKNSKSNIKTHVEELWRRFGIRNLDELNEDLLIIAMSVFAIDKKLPRKLFEDNWTREIELNIPVLAIDKWNVVKEKLESTLSFLSGDNWIIKFRISNERYRGNKINKKYKTIETKKFDCVSLFSGGLDSFCGALKLVSNNQNVCFIGFKEYKMLGGRQYELFNAIDAEFNKVDKELLLFNTNPGIPLNIMGEKYKVGSEITSRSRSFLFLAGALAVASIIGDVPVFIPENGFIGINVPLTDSRLGSCSTRTTHPFFLKNLNDILELVGIENKVINPYAEMTKGEVVKEVSELNAFQVYGGKTISCSHPCQSRYDKLSTPMNCGYCYPCLIRKASMNKVGYSNDEYNPNNIINKSFIYNNNALEGKAKDLKAVLYSLSRYLNKSDDDKYINRLLLKPGKLDSNEIQIYNGVYKETMEEIKNMIIAEESENNADLINYLGIERGKIINE